MSNRDYLVTIEIVRELWDCGINFPVDILAFKIKDKFTDKSYDNVIASAFRLLKIIEIMKKLKKQFTKNELPESIEEIPEEISGKTPKEILEIALKEFKIDKLKKRDKIKTFYHLQIPDNFFIGIENMFDE